MDVALFVLTAQGLITPSVVRNSVSAKSRTHCASLCLQNRTCSAIFYDDGEPHDIHCYLSDEPQNVALMTMDSSAMKYYEMHSDDCNNGYTYIGSMNLCYKVHPTTMAWSSANAGCIKEGAHLIRIKTATVNNLILSVSKQNAKYVWTDGKGGVDGFQWQDGSEVKNPFWANGEPNPSVNTPVYCIIVNYRENEASTSWHDLICTATYAIFVCQKDVLY